MNNVVLINNQEVGFEVVDNQTFTTSLDIANVFEKRHDNIIAQIRALPSDDFNALNFKVVKYTDSKGEKRPMYKISRDGFSLLVMGFTGKKAYEWKVEFIKAFNLMEAELKQLNNKYQINGYKSQLAQHNNKIVELEQKLASLQNANPNENIEFAVGVGRYYKEKAENLEKKHKEKEKIIFHALSKINQNLEQVYTAIEAVASYALENETYFIKNNELLNKN